MRLLIGGSSSFLFHLKEFSDTLNSLGVESKLVFDSDYADGFPSRKIKNWFQTKKKFNKLIDEFKPDAIFVDRQRHFGINALKANIPLFVLLRGHYWSELYWNKRTMYKPFHKRIALWQWDKLGKEIFNGATASVVLLLELMVLPQFFQFVNIWKKLQTNLFPTNLPKYFLKALTRQNGIKSKE